MNLERLKELRDALDKSYVEVGEPFKGAPVILSNDVEKISEVINLLPNIIAYIESLEKKVEAGEFLARRMDNFTPTLYPIMDAKGESNLVYVNDALTRWHKTVSEMLDDYRKQVE